MLFGILDFIKKKKKTALKVSVIGSGGKTTLLRTLAKQASEHGMKTVLTTTTHMKYPFSPFINLSPDLSQKEAETLMKSVLKDHFIVVSAEDGACLELNKLHSCSYSKLSSVKNKNIEIFSKTADLLISESDGSKQLPMKATNDREPVLLPDSDLVILVFGLSALGRPLSEVCHRFEIAKELLEVGEEEPVSEEMAAELLCKSYLEKLKNEKIAILLNQADTEDLRLKAKKITDLLMVERVEIIGNNPLRVKL